MGDVAERAGDGSRGTTPESFPAAVLMERRQVCHRGWTVPQWRVLTVLVGNEAAGMKAGRRLVHRADDCDRYLYGGYTLCLYKDAAESYWYNVAGSRPSLFVICRVHEDGELVPFKVSANHDEAGAHMEADDEVYSVPMPPEVHTVLARYVAAHHVPGRHKKRTREDWTHGEEQFARRRPRRGRGG